MDPLNPIPTVPVEAPGARGARVCGILAIILALTCIGIPVAIVLGIVALVLQAKAKRLAREAPEAYRMPTQTGLVTGIIGLVLPAVMLPFLGIVSAIAIPALLGQRERARERAVQGNLAVRMADLSRLYDEAAVQGGSEADIKARLEAQIPAWNTQDRNPWDPQQAVYATEVQVVFGAEDGEAVAQSFASTRGQVVFVAQFPRPGQAGFLAGAVRVSAPTQEDRILTRVVSLDHP